VHAPEMNLIAVVLDASGLETDFAKRADGHKR
jgi:hypothetical protein